MHARPSTAAASRPPLLLSRVDVERIEALLEQPSFSALDTRALQEELARAELAEPAAIPDDVITMNSTARVRVDDPLQGAHEHEITLVYPRDADGSADRVSMSAKANRSRSVPENRASAGATRGCSHAGGGAAGRG